MLHKKILICNIICSVSVVSEHLSWCLSVCVVLWCDVWVGCGCVAPPRDAPPQPNTHLAPRSRREAKRLPWPGPAGSGRLFCSRSSWGSNKSKRGGRDAVRGWGQRGPAQAWNH